MFSIIVPSYNRKAEIPALLESLHQQTVTHFEVIIVDDCSREPVELNQEYAFPCTVIRNPQNLGAAESRNVGARQARYDWLLFLDDDDRFLAEKCAVLAQAIAQHPEVNFIYHPAYCVMVNEGFTYQTHPYADPALLTLENLLRANKIGGMPMIAVKKSLFLKVGGLSSYLRALEDYEFLLKLVSDEDFQPLYVEQALTRCTFHTKRASVSTNTSHTEQAIEEIKARYVKTTQQAQAFELNALYMLAYPYMMNLSRGAARYYAGMFRKSGQLKYGILALLTCLSPKLVIQMKRFI
ncbi:MULTISPECIES: glycosyltransferase family 2 protein [Pasteurella]|uniref:Glycosyltransferase n=1 Tax=Pasteurella multocida TaxID=747 RepID=A0A849CHS5_PASMD|nr:MULTISPECIES: glycosyltransferase family 2 protein [Pasteurella]AFF23789.1 glycosyl transferase, family 2 protein-1 [Pasteurella multocida subsp. multocida str. HN06]AFI45930.1 WcaA protein [Pasteurella multocida subsp. multocida str. 3480]AMM81326.1 glycosyltransferase [Pasteurella multocida subsp. multocida PMTB2.1]APW58000.1 glycosyltransferase [Pasteurella multocida]AXQ72317.1 glycosyltransferase [Pasteurella multocida subsp. multocida]